jgi:hypothetical protein
MNPTNSVAKAANQERGALRISNRERMNYWRDTANGQIYFACVILTNSENPKEPPKIIGLGPLLAEERFIPVDSPETDVVSITLPASSSLLHSTSPTVNHFDAPRLSLTAT